MSVDKFGRSPSISAASSGVSLNYANNTFLKLDGSNVPLSGLSMNNKSVLNLGKPVDQNSAVSKFYIDNELNKTLKLNGSTYPTADINMNAKKITNMKNGSLANDAATISNIWTEVSGKAFLLDGTSLPTDNISMNNKKITSLAMPTDQFDAVNKGYADSKFVTKDYIFNPLIDDSMTEPRRVEIDNADRVFLISFRSSITSLGIEPITDTYELSQSKQRATMMVVVGNEVKMLSFNFRLIGTAVEVSDFVSRYSVDMGPLNSANYELAGFSTFVL